VNFELRNLIWWGRQGNLKTG